MGNTVSKLHTKFHRANFIKKRSNGRHTPVSIRVYVGKRRIHKDSKTKKIGLKNKKSGFLEKPSREC